MDEPMRRSKDGRITNERGIVLIVVLLLIVTLGLLGVAANRNVVTDTGIASNHLSSIQAFYVAEAGAEYGFNKLWLELQKLNPNAGSISPPALTGYTLSGSSYVSSIGSVVTRTTTTGSFDGLTAFVQKYRVTSRATENRNNAVSKVAIEVEDQLIPLFQFGIFYEDDLEVGPGANMTFSGGRIHSNNDLFLTAYSGRTLSLDSKITSAGSVFHYDKAGRATQSGTVQIKDGAATPAYHTLDIDSQDTTWTGDSQTRWTGKIKNDVHGIKTLNMPLATGGQAIDIIGTGSNSLYSKAGLKVIDGVATDKNGNAVDLRYYDPNYKDALGNLKIDPGGTSALNVNPISTATSNPTFYDGREQKTMTAVEVDLTKLQNSAAARNALSDPPSGGDPGIIYVSSSTITNPAVRLVNGSALDSTKLPQGLSVGSDNPVYVKGDYNTANRPAAIFADAVTVLSGSWDDAKSTSGIDSRVAANTTVNAAIMAGNRNTNGTDYSGGAENFIRFLEKWTGKTLTYSGSLVCMWESQQATRKWPGTGSVYTAPTRNWSYGINYSNLPPGTPRVRNIVRLGWRQVSN
jgi:hypothetical protein